MAVSITTGKGKGTTGKGTTGKGKSKDTTGKGKKIPTGKNTPAALGAQALKDTGKGSGRADAQLGRTAGHATRPTIRATVYGKSVASVLRAGGCAGANFATLRAWADALGLATDGKGGGLKDNTIRCQLQSGQHHPDGIHGPAAELEGKDKEDFLSALRAAARKVEYAGEIAFPPTYYPKGKKGK